MLQGFCVTMLRMGMQKHSQCSSKAHFTLFGSLVYSSKHLLPDYYLYTLPDAMENIKMVTSTDFKLEEFYFSL